MIEIIFLLLLVGLVAASYCDIKTREVPDWLNFSLIFAGFGLRIIQSLAEASWHPLLVGITGFLPFLALSLILYYTRQWGGGDSKLLMAAGVLIGYDYALPLMKNQMFWFLLSLLLAGAVYGLLFIFYFAVRDRKKVILRAKELFRQGKTWRWLFLSLEALFLSFSFTAYFYLAKNLIFFSLILLPPIFYFLFLLTKAVEEVSFIREVKPEQLTEGDWLAEEIPGHKFSRLGLEKEEIRKLRNLGLHSVKIKTGIPFVPSFFLAYLLAYYVPLIFSQLIL
ncbi:prepilin peptidase [Candidatus Woesearchaeota archaeon]|nr:prepilin peptidase [Candidatus Woesearchaeota archaeon]